MTKGERTGGQRGQRLLEEPLPPVRSRFFPRLTRGLAAGLAAGLLIIVLTLVIIGGTLDHDLRAIDRLVEQIIKFEEPTSAAAYEMEINVLGTGLGV